VQAKTVLEYKGYRIEVGPVGKGWRAAIFAPGSIRALADSPSNLEKSSTQKSLRRPNGLSMRGLARVRCKFFPTDIDSQQTSASKRRGLCVSARRRIF
jgi:hypothetical protein